MKQKVKYLPCMGMTHGKLLFVWKMYLHKFVWKMKAWKISFLLLNCSYVFEMLQDALSVFKIQVSITNASLYLTI